MRRTLQVKFLLILLGAGLALGAGLYALYHFQLNRHTQAFLEQAREAEAQNQPDRAATALKRYLDFQPDNYDALARYALLLSRKPESPDAHERAIQILDQVVRHRPNRHDIRYRRVLLAMQAGQFAIALKHLQILHEANPRNGELAQFFARCEEANRAYARAAAWYAKAIEHAPQQLDNYSRLAALLRVHLHDPVRADESMDALVAANSQSFQAHLLRARYRRQFKTREDAAEDVAAARALAPQEPEVLVAAAEGAWAAGKAKDAASDLRQCLRLQPGRAALYPMLASVEAQSGRRAEAVACLRQGLKTLPEREHGPLLLSLTDLLIQGGELTEARTVLARLRRGTAPALPDYYEARLLAEQRQWGQAAALLERGLPQFANFKEGALKANLLLALCYERLGDADQECEAYRRAVALAGTSVPARLGLATALLNAGDGVGAVAECRRLMELPGAPPGGWALLGRALLLQNLGRPAAQRDWAEVEKALGRAVQATPTAAAVPLLHADALAAEGQWVRARAVLEQACDRQPKEPALWLALAGRAERQELWESPLVQASSAAGFAGLPAGTGSFLVPAAVLGTGAAGQDSAAAVLARARGALGDRLELSLAALHAPRRSAAALRKGLAALEKELDGKLSAGEEQTLLAGLANAYAGLGDVEKAKRLWGQLAERQPQQLGVRFRLFDLARQTGDEALAQRVLAEIKGIEGADGTLWRYADTARLIAQARRGERGALAAARARLTEITRRRPGWARLPALAGEVAELEGQREQALEHYRQAVAKGDRRPAVVQRLVQLLHEQRRYAEAAQALRELHESARLSGDFRRLAADVALRADDAGRALALARQAVADDPKDARNHLWLGLSLWATAGPGAEAEAALRRALAVGNGAADCWLALIHYLARTGRQDEAADLMQEARRPGPAARPPLVLAHACEALGRPDEAADFYKAAAAGPADAAALHAAADFHLRHNRFAAAVPHLRRLLDPAVRAPDRDVRWARRNLALGLALTGSYSQLREALALLGQNEAGGPAPREDRRARAVVLAQHPAHRGAAIRLFEGLLAADGLAPDDLFLLVRLHEANRDDAKVRQHLKTLLALPQGQSPTVLAWAAHALLRQGEAYEAWRCLVELRKQEPDTLRTVALQARLHRAERDNAAALRVLQAYAGRKDADPRQVAALLEEVGQEEAADALFSKYVAAGRPEALLVRAAFLGRQKRLAEALDLCERAWPDCPPEQTAGVCVALLHTEPAAPAHYARVERWLAGALAKGPRTAPLLLALADVRALQERAQDAVALHREVLAADAGNVVALNNLAWLLGRQGDKSAEALALIDRALDRRGPLAALLDTRAVIHLAAGRGELAMKDLQEAVAQEPTAARYYHLAQAHFLARQRERALEALDSAQGANLTGQMLHPLERPSYERLLRDLDRS